LLKKEATASPEAGKERERHGRVTGVQEKTADAVVELCNVDD
jgi:ribosomal protein L24